MRQAGHIQSWNDDRGFGFIEPEAGGPRVFVHVSAFERGYGRPTATERVYFDLTTDERGRPRAVNVSYTEQPRAFSVKRRPHSSSRRGRSRGLGRAVLTAAAAVGLAIAGWQQLGSGRTESSFTSAPLLKPAPSTTFQCEGKRHCNEMTSCEEATYYLDHCPGVEIDGDADGIPCEQQWCGR